MKPVLKITFCSLFLVVISQPVVFAQIIQQKINTYDSFGNPLEIEDAKGVKVSYDWSEDGTVPIGIFQNADKDEIFAHSFALDSLEDWTVVNAGNNVTTGWSIDEGKLKMYHPGTVGSNWSADYIKATLATEYTDRTVIEMDVVIGNDNHYSLTISAGGSSYPGGNGGSENLIWTSFRNGVWKYYNGSTFLDIKGGFISGETYALKIVADPITDKVDYYVNGEIVKTAVDGRTATTGIQTIGIGNYGRSSIASTFYIDNVRIYPEKAQAQSQEIDPLHRAPVAIKDVSGATQRFTYDDSGRLEEVYNSNGEIVTSNKYYYSLDGSSSYNPADPNRVESWTHYDPNNSSNVTKSVQYMDGLGRGIQTQVRGGNTTIITDTRYNERGLPEVISRPYQIANQTTYKQYGFEGNSSGTFVAGSALPSNSPIEDEYQSLPNNDEDYAYSQVEYEDSPLARTVKSTLPGPSHKMGSGKEMETSYGLNTTETFATSAQGSMPAKTWAINTLTKTVSEDPNGKKTISYTDGWGQTIASGVDMDGNGRLDGQNKSSCYSSNCDLITEFVYDLRGNLVRVEDPRGLVTTYTYNELGQLTSKKLPDQGYDVDYKYDEKGRLRFVHDPNHKSTKQDLSQSLVGGVSTTKTIVATSNGELSFNFSWVDLYLGNYTITIKRTDDNTTIYSNTLTAEWGSISTQTFNVSAGTYEFKGLAQDQGDIVYTSGSFDFESNDIFTYTKYDELDRPVETGEYAGSTSFSSADPDADTFPTSGNEANIQYYYDGDQAYSGTHGLSSQNQKGRLTKVSYRDLSVSASSWGYTWYSYNSLGLVEWVVQDPPGLAEKKIEYEYDELGRLTQMDYQAGVSGEEFYQRYTYDAMGRMTKVETSTNGSTWVKDVEYTSFFADGQVGQMKLGNSAIQTVDYAYTVQGWLDKINNGSISTGTNGDRFGMNLDYDFNGNIDLQEWRQVGTSGTNQNLLSYSYSYDNANRLTAANFSGSGYNSSAFDLEWMNYDDNGNITGYLRRDNNGNIGYDGIGYFGMTYETGTNRIDKITEQVDYLDFDIDHDANGNMTKNELQGFTSVDYDWRNLPAQLIKGANTLQYAYDSEGNRIKKKMGSTETHYVRGAGGETIAMYEGGSIVSHNILAGADLVGTWDGTQRRYFLKDHLGSVRTTVDQSGNVDGYDDYYPFGLTMPGRSSNSANPNDDYKFTGHERDDEAGLTIDYMMARNYDPIIGRFMQIDPLADQFPGWSPYNYTFNNPLIHTDPDGRSPWRLVKMGVNIAKRSYKTYKKTGKLDVKAAAVDEVVSLVENVKTLADGELNGDDVYAIIDLVSGFGGEAKRATKKLGELSDNSFVVRGGSNKAKNFENGTGVSIDNKGNLDGVSVNSKNGISVKELSEGIPHSKVGVTTVGDVRKAGGNVVPSPTKNNPNHATLSGISPEKAEELMTPVKKNPTKD